MEGHIFTKPNAPKKLLQIISLAVFLITLFFPAPDLYADNLDECLLETLKHADDSVTVGQLREQCQPETETRSIGKPSQDSSSVEKNNAPNNNMMSEKADSPLSSNGPEEMVLKTSLAKKPAYFPHKTHQDKYTCGTCHHGKNTTGSMAKYTDKTVIYKCMTCHNADMPNEKLNSFQMIGHKLCRECHRTNRDKTSAKCSTCHLKNL